MGFGVLLCERRSVGTDTPGPLPHLSLMPITSELGTALPSSLHPQGLGHPGSHVNVAIHSLTLWNTCVLTTLHGFPYFTLTGTVVMSTLPMRKLRLTEGKSAAPVTELAVDPQLTASKPIPEPSSWIPMRHQGHVYPITACRTD